MVGPDRALVTVIDNAVPFPTNYESLELRTDGLWADHHVETPLEHFSLGLEAFGVALDDPADTYQRLRAAHPARLRPGVGDRRPALPLAPGDEPLRDPLQRARRDPGRRRAHRVRGTRPARPLVGRPRLVDPGLVLDGVPAGRRHPVPRRDHPALGGVRHRLRPGRSGPGSIWSTAFDADPTLGPDAIPSSAALEVEGLALTVDPLAWSPVLLVGPDGCEARFPRAMARFTAADGRSGIGWIEFNQPPA